MISIARVFISQPPIIPNQGKGWLELPNGQRIKPSVSQVYFAPWSQKPYMPEPKKRRWFSRLMGIAA